MSIKVGHCPRCRMSAPRTTAIEITTGDLYYVHCKFCHYSTPVFDDVIMAIKWWNDGGYSNGEREEIQKTLLGTDPRTRCERKEEDGT